MKDGKAKPVVAADVAPRVKPSVYPEPFKSRMQGRTKRQLGEVFGIKNFGVNLTTLHPGGESALFHKHAKQDEFIYVVSGRPTLITEEGEFELSPGMCAGFPKGTGDGHHFLNRTDTDAVILVIGDRTAGDVVTYPDDDLLGTPLPGGGYVFTHKDGTSY